MIESQWRSVAAEILWPSVSDDASQRSVRPGGGSTSSGALPTTPGKHRWRDSFSLFARMAAGDYFVQVSELDARVDFGGGKPAMAQQLLDLPNIGGLSTSEWRR